MFIVLISSVVSILGLWAAFRYKDSYDEWLPRGFAIALTVAWILVGSMISLDNKMKIERMEVFQSVTVENYREIVSQTLLLSDEPSKSEWSIEKFALYQSLSQRLLDFNREITEYNRDLAGWRVLRGNPFTNWFVPDLDNLELVKL